MDPKTYSSLLVEHPFFNGMKAEHLNVLAGCASDVDFEPGTYVFRAGEEARHFYLIREGNISLELAAAGHDPIFIISLGGGDVLGWSWLIPPYRWKFDSRVVERTRTICLDGEHLRARWEKDHELGFELLSRFSLLSGQRLETARIRLLDMYAAD